MIISRSQKFSKMTTFSPVSLNLVLSSDDGVEYELYTALRDIFQIKEQCEGEFAYHGINGFYGVDVDSRCRSSASKAVTPQRSTRRVLP